MKFHIPGCLRGCCAGLLAYGVGYYGLYEGLELPAILAALGALVVYIITAFSPLPRGVKWG